MLLSGSATKAIRNWPSASVTNESDTKVTTSLYRLFPNHLRHHGRIIDRVTE